MKDEGLAFGYIEIEERDLDTGEVYRHGPYYNKIVKVGRKQMRGGAMKGSSVDQEALAVGSDSTATSAGMTALQSEQFRDVFTTEDHTTDVESVFKLSLNANTGNGTTYEEIGIFNTSTDNSGSMFSRTTFSGVTKDSTKSIQFNYTIKFESSN